jgi:tRNA A37 threonylcarbamoyladenosine synthetase subunit TsaC/SUA5/YrdC
VDLRARITFILPLDADSKPAWLSDRVEVGVRIPDDDRIQAILALTGPLFATSANLHGRPPGIACSAILADLKGVPAAVWDVGQLGGTASTVVNFNAEPPKVLRWGVVDDLTKFGLGHA